MTIEDVADRCKAAVSLEINDHLNCYQSAKEYNEDFECWRDLSEERRAELLASKNIFRLQFYPNTPVGFYQVYGDSLQDVVDQASAILTLNEMGL